MKTSNDEGVWWKNSGNVEFTDLEPFFGFRGRTRIKELL